jgi:hypothetical protein
MSHLISHEDKTTQLYNNRDLVKNMIRIAVDKVIENYREWKNTSPFCNVISTDTDYTLVNIYTTENKIYNKTLTLVCLHGYINLDVVINSINKNEKKEYTVLSSHKLNSKTSMEMIYNNLFEIYQDITTNNPQLQGCEKCLRSFYKDNVCGELIKNICKACEAPLFLCLKNSVMNKVECNVCYSKILEQSSDRFVYKTIFSVQCCKGKRICKECLYLLKKRCGCLVSDECSETECPFCKQCLQVNFNL